MEQAAQNEGLRAAGHRISLGWDPKGAPNQLFQISDLLLSCNLLHTIDTVKLVRIHNCPCTACEVTPGAGLAGNLGKCYATLTSAPN